MVLRIELLERLAMELIKSSNLSASNVICMSFPDREMLALTDLLSPEREKEMVLSLMLYVPVTSLLFIVSVKLDSPSKFNLTLPSSKPTFSKYVSILLSSWFATTEPPADFSKFSDSKATAGFV